MQVNIASYCLKLIYNSLSDFVSNCISTHQFEFTKGRSSLQQLLVYLNNIVDATDGSASVDVMYLDLCKAFDSVLHTKLLHKLHTYGISGKLWNCFKSYIYMTDNNVSELVKQSHVSYQYYMGYPKVVFWGSYYFYCIYQ